MSGQTPTSKAFKLTVLTAAVGAGSVGAAGAATISYAPSGYVPLVFATNASASSTFDIDGNGTADFTVSSSGIGSILLGATSSSSAYSGFINVSAYATPDSFVPVTSLKSNSGGNAGSDFFTSIGSSGASSNFSAQTPMYAELGTNMTYSGGTITGGTIGYILGTRAVLSGAGTSAEVDSFTINDFGLIGTATAVPEPSSIALLAMGGAGIVALRRRRSARAA